MRDGCTSATSASDVDCGRLGSDKEQRLNQGSELRQRKAVAWRHTIETELRSG